MADPKPHTRLLFAKFSASIPFAGSELTTASVGRNVESLTPAVISASGEPLPTKAEQRSDGLLLRARVRSASGGQAIAQAFVPWAGVGALVYGE